MSSRTWVSVFSTIADGIIWRDIDRAWEQMPNRRLGSRAYLKRHSQSFQSKQSCIYRRAPSWIWWNFLCILIPHRVPLAVTECLSHWCRASLRTSLRPLLEKDSRRHIAPLAFRPDFIWEHQNKVQHYKQGVSIAKTASPTLAWPNALMLISHRILLAIQSPINHQDSPQTLEFGQASLILKWGTQISKLGLTDLERGC